MPTKIVPTSLDITIALQAAINAADPTKGATIIIPDGTWQISNAVLINGRRSINITGEGRNTKVEITYPGPGFISEASAYCSIANLRVAPMVPHAGYAIHIYNSLVFKLENLVVRSHIAGTEGELPNKGAIVCRGILLNGSSNQISDSIIRVADHCLTIDGSRINPADPVHAGFIVDKVTCHPSEVYPSAIPLLVQKIGGGSLVNVSCLGGFRTEFRDMGSNASCVNSTFTDGAAATLFDPNVRNFSIANTWFGSNAGGLDLRGSKNMFTGCNFRGVTAQPLRLGGTLNVIQGSTFEVLGAAGKQCLFIDASSYIVNGNRMTRIGAGTVGAIGGHTASPERILTGNISY